MWNMWDLILVGAGTAIVGVAYMPLEQKGEKKESVIRAKRVELSNGTGRAEITLSDSGDLKFKIWKESGGRFEMHLGDRMRLFLYSKTGGIFQIAKAKRGGMFCSVSRGQRRIMIAKQADFCGFTMGNAKGRFVFQFADSRKNTAKVILYGANEQAAFSAGVKADGGWIRTGDRDGKDVFRVGAEDVGRSTVALHDIEGRNVFSVASSRRAVSATIGGEGWGSVEQLEFGEDGKLRLKPVPLRKDAK